MINKFTLGYPFYHFHFEKCLALHVKQEIVSNKQLFMDIHMVGSVKNILWHWIL